VTVLGDSVTVLGATVSGASVPVEEPELGSEVSGTLEVLGDTESEGLVDDDLQPDSATNSPTATTGTLLRSSITPATNDAPAGRVIGGPFNEQH
jgi:hypothetical protein